MPLNCSHHYCPRCGKHYGSLKNDCCDGRCADRDYYQREVERLDREIANGNANGADRCGGTGNLAAQRENAARRLAQLSGPPTPPSPRPGTTHP